MVPLWQALNQVMNLWNMIREFTPKLKELHGLKTKNKDLNGNKLITLSYVMDGEKRLLKEKQLNIGFYKTVGVMIGVKLDLMVKRKDISECKEV